MHWSWSAVSALVLFACSASLDAGLKVTVRSLRLQPSSNEPELPAWQTNLGYSVRVTTFDLAATGVDLMPCPTLGWRDRLLRQFEGTAFAHSEGSPTRSGAPVVESLLTPGDRAQLPLASFAPPPGDYCGITYHAGAADADAQGMPSDGSMLNKSLRVVGSFRRGNAGPVTPFSFETSAAFDCVLPFAATSLDGDRQRSLVVLVAYADDGLFDDIEFLSQDPADSARRLLANLRAGMTAVRGDFTR